MQTTTTATVATVATTTAIMPETSKEIKKSVDWIDAADFATMTSIELEKAKYLLREVLDYLTPLRYSVENKEYRKARDLAFADICGAETMARIVADVLFNLNTATDDFITRIKAD